MPLKPGSSPKVIKSNISEAKNKGISSKQAVAMALSSAEKYKKEAAKDKKKKK
jgi:hypothetical protein